MEIERKFLIDKIPSSLENYDKIEIEQGYISREPIIRIRKANEKYILTIKSKFGVGEDEGSHIISNELECEITENEYESLKKKNDGVMLRKTRYIIPLEAELKAELDIFKDRLEGLIFAEVEFASVESANSFKKPEWMGKDVSKDPRYRNSEIIKLDKYSEENFKEKI